MMTLYRRALLFWCSCIISGGCATFQTGPSEPLPDAERLMVAGRGQLRIIERNPQAAQTVLLVHGYGASSASWLPVISMLAERFHVIALDLPGFGRSDKRAGDYSPAALADVLAAVLDEKRVARAHVLGHSWGSSVVLAFALRHRDRLDKLAVVSGWMYDEQLYPLMRWTRAPGGDALYAMFYRQNIGERMYLNFHDPSRLSQEVVDEVERSMYKPGALAAAVAAARGMRFAESEYHRIDAPTLVLWGRDDRVARLPFGERLARDLPRARLVVLPRCGHIPMWECTGETAAALRDFLTEQPLAHAEGATR
jgi:pimeloyl-ACP methyl ester carboxylesterase